MKSIHSIVIIVLFVVSTTLIITAVSLHEERANTARALQNTSQCETELSETLFLLDIEISRQKYEDDR